MSGVVRECQLGFVLANHDRKVIGEGVCCTLGRGNIGGLHYMSKETANMANGVYVPQIRSMLDMYTTCRRSDDASQDC